MNRAFFCLVAALISICAAGCGSSDGPIQINDLPPLQLDGHAEAGPHEGRLVELGVENYHAEIVADPQGGRLTVYLLDAAAKEPVVADDDQLFINLLMGGRPRQFVLRAVDGAGRQQFESRDRELLDATSDDASNGRLNVTIKQKQYIGRLGAQGHHH